MISCPKVLQVWVKDRSRLTFAAVAVAVILTTNKKVYVHHAVMVKTHACENTNGVREIDPWAVNNQVSISKVLRPLQLSEVCSYVRYYWNRWQS